MSKRTTEPTAGCFYAGMRSEMISYELRVVSCYFKKINLRVVSYFLRVTILKE